MGQITGGKVTFGRTVQPAQYESKKAEVEISWVVYEGESNWEDWLEKASQVAEAKALELVGLKPNIQTTTSPLRQPKKTASKPIAAPEPEQLEIEDAIKEVTDKELNEEVTKVVNKTKNAPAIRALRATYGVMSVRELPQEKRVEFITKLADIAPLEADADAL